MWMLAYPHMGSIWEDNTKEKELRSSCFETKLDSFFILNGKLHILLFFPNYFY